LLLARQQLRDDGVPAAAGIAQHEQVVAGLLDVDAEAHRIQRARLADDVGGIAQFRGGFEVQQGRIAAPQQRLRIEGG
jgi:hypothetical protein